MPAFNRSETLLYPITASLIRRVLRWALLFILVFGSLRAWLEYEQAQARFHRVVHSVADIQLPLLSVAVWDIETQTIQRQLELLRASAPVAYALVRVNTGQQFSSGLPHSPAAGAAQHLDIPAPGNPAERIGTLEVAADMGVFYSEVAGSVAWAMLQCALLVGLVLGMVVAVLRQDLERPMRQLARFVTGLRANELTHKLELQRRPGHRYDEIDLVADGFQTLQARIQAHISTLDAEVAERTLQLQTALTALKTLSLTDALTGCYNRLLFNERFAREMSRSGRYGRPLSVIFCDIDFFKQVNDRHGHQAGDQVLARLGECLRRLLRSDVDWVVRYGGEEFVIVLPETALPEAWKTAERIRLEVALNLAIALDNGQTLRVSVSMGVAQQGESDDQDSLIRRADEYLYAAKHAGRNQVWPPGPDRGPNPVRAMDADPPSSQKPAQSAAGR